jgi:glutaconate CoA-transferase subunit A
MDKRATVDDLIEVVKNSSSISFGGGGHVRKPMAAVCALARSDMSPVDVNIFLGGPEVDILIAYEKVRRLHFSFMGLGPLGLLPHFRAAREGGQLDVIEASEYLIIAGLEASARGVPFMPTRSGLGTDILTRPNTPYRLTVCPFTGETLVAVPPLPIDVAILHVNVADSRGNFLIYGDPFVDDLLTRAAKQVWVTAERVVDRLAPMDGRAPSRFVSRVWTTGVVEIRGGAGFTGCYPDYQLDLDFTAEYQRQAKDRAWLDAYTERAALIAKAGAA